MKYRLDPLSPNGLSQENSTVITGGGSSISTATGAVDSVNGQTGTVVLDADDIGDGTNNKAYTATDKTKLAGIESGAEVNVNADWDSATGDSQILNKPTLGTAASQDTTAFATAAQGTKADSAIQSVVAGTNVTVDDTDPLNPVVSASGSGGAVDSVNSQTGDVVLDADDIDDTSTTNKFTTSSDITKLSGIESGADVTDATNVAAAGAIMDGDFSTNGLMKRTGSGSYGTAASGTDYAPATSGSAILKGNGSGGFSSATAGTDYLAPAAIGATVEAHDTDLTSIAGLSPTNDDIIQRKSGAWTNRTPSQLKTDLSLTKSDVGLGNVDNTSDTNKPVSTAQQTALDLKANLSILTSETINQNSTYQAFGDSITAGSGASTSANRYVNLVAAEKGWTLTNYGVGGARLNDHYIMDAILNISTSYTGNYSLMCGTNNYHRDTDDKAYQASFREGLMACVAWLAIPNAYKQTGLNRTSETGTWTANDSALYNSGMGKNSTVNGSTITFHAQGSTVYVAYIKTASGGAEFKVTVDGFDVATVSAVGSVDPRSVDSSTYQESLIRIPNLSDRDHTVVITVTSSTSSSNRVFIDWVAGNGFPAQKSGPNVWVGDVLMATDASYTLSGGSDDIVGQYNSLVYSVTSDLARDGLRVTLVDSVNSVNVDSELAADGVHPNDAGHAKLATAFLTSMSSITKTNDRGAASRKSVGWTNATLLNSWVAFSTSTFHTARYMKDQNGAVWVEGMMKSGTIGNNPIFILPPGFRPSRVLTFPVRSNNAYGHVEVWPNGEVRPVSGNTASFGLDTIHFMAEW
jgi:Cu/Ag efflux protein CusF